MTFFASSGPAPVDLPDGPRQQKSVYTGTACLALMDAAVTGQVWEDILYDGTGHDHGSGGLMLHPAAFGTHLEHDGDFPVEVVTNETGQVLGFRVNIDPYGDDLSEVRELHAHDDGHAHTHDHGDGESHSHAHNHDEDHDHDHPHVHDGHGHPDGWSPVETVRLETASVVFGDPAGLPEADDTGDLVGLEFPAPGGQLRVTVYAQHGLRREIRAVWSR